MEGTLEAHLCTLINKDAKTGGDFQEIDLLGHESGALRACTDTKRLARADLNPEIRKRNEGGSQAQQLHRRSD